VIDPCSLPLLLVVAPVPFLALLAASPAPLPFLLDADPAPLPAPLAMDPAPLPVLLAADPVPFLALLAASPAPLPFLLDADPAPLPAPLAMDPAPLPVLLAADPVPFLALLAASPAPLPFLLDADPAPLPALLAADSVSLPVLLAPDSDPAPSHLLPVDPAPSPDVLAAAPAPPLPAALAADPVPSPADRAADPANPPALLVDPAPSLALLPADPSPPDPPLLLRAGPALAHLPVAPASLLGCTAASNNRKAAFPPSVAELPLRASLAVPLASPPSVLVHAPHPLHLRQRWRPSRQDLPLDSHPAYHPLRDPRHPAHPLHDPRHPLCPVLASWHWWKDLQPIACCHPLLQLLSNQFQQKPLPEEFGPRVVRRHPQHQQSQQHLHPARPREVPTLIPLGCHEHCLVPRILREKMLMVHGSYSVGAVCHELLHLAAVEADRGLPRLRPPLLTFLQHSVAVSPARHASFQQPHVSAPQ